MPRSLYARLLDRLRSVHPRLVALDLQFTEASQPEEDLALYEAVERARPVVLATTAAEGRARDYRALGRRRTSARPGRWSGWPSFPSTPTAWSGECRAACAACGPSRSPSAPTSSAGSTSAPWTLAAHGSISAVRPGRSTRSRSGGRSKTSGCLPAFGDKIVVVGAEAPTLHDLHPTSAPCPRLMSGIELQASAIATALGDGLPLRPRPRDDRHRGDRPAGGDCAAGRDSAASALGDRPGDRGLGRYVRGRPAGLQRGPRRQRQLPRGRRGDRPRRGDGRRVVRRARRSATACASRSPTSSPTTARSSKWSSAPIGAHPDGFPLARDQIIAVRSRRAPRRSRRHGRRRPGDATESQPPSGAEVGPPDDGPAADRAQASASSASRGSPPPPSSTPT